MKGTTMDRTRMDRTRMERTRMDRTLCRHNLGGAILARAIEDYRDLDPRLHETAKAFLYPRTRAARAHLLWVIWLLPEVNPAWLRDVLDCHQRKWEGQRRMHALDKRVPLPVTA